MQSRFSKSMLVVAMVIGVGLGGCRRSTTEPVAAPSELGQSELGQSELGQSELGQRAEPIAEQAKPSIELTLECPENVAVGKVFAIQVTVENRGPRATPDDWSMWLRYDSARLESVKSEAEALADVIQRGLGRLEPGRTWRTALSFRAIEPGTSCLTAEVRRDEEVLASQWTTVTTTGPKPETDDMPDDELSDEPPLEEYVAPPEPDLGPPLVENRDALQKLHPDAPIWFDATEKSVVMVGAVCQRQAMLELFACQRRSKEHEAVIAVPIKAYVLHAGLLATGAEPGHPAQFKEDEYIPPSGTEIEIKLHWKDEQGNPRSARAQDWIRNIQTGKAMSSPWVFAGSQLIEHPQTGKRVYLADSEGDLICVVNFPSAVLDVPVKSSDADASLLFDTFTERIPPLGTPVTLVLAPKADDDAKGPTDPFKDLDDVTKDLDNVIQDIKEDLKEIEVDSDLESKIQKPKPESEPSEESEPQAGSSQ